ncbi:MAG: endonuclease/exonuclease/phosphatase family protein [Nitrosomonadales bacterium]|nr:endonuclease/exonuclease/phosphatase family protein [Nitrosomonadales bacterium]
MKIATYNLHFGGHINKGNHWQKLDAEFLPDFICAQESWHPTKYFSPDEFSQFKGCIHANVYHGKWGSAILSRKHKLEEISLSLPEFDGWVVGAKIPDMVIGDAAQPVLLFSIHAPSPGPYEPRVIRMIEAIAQQWSDAPIIIAGDFNVTTAIRKESESMKNTPGEIKILNRLKDDLGLLNAWQHLHPQDELPQTLRWSNKPSDKFHCDAVFVSSNLVPYLSSAEVIGTGNWATMSDHNPLIVTLR